MRQAGEEGIGAAGGVDDWRFVPHPLLRGGDAQTVAGLVWPRPSLRSLGRAEERLVPAPGGGHLLLRCHLRRGAPTVLLVHGLEGSDHVSYIVSTARRALDLGWGVARLNLRSCGGTERLSPTIYHPGLSADVGAAVDDLIDAGVRRLSLVGFSLGGNLVLKLAGEYGAAAPRALRAVAAISPCVDLSASSAALDARHNWLYRWLFLNAFRLRVHRRRAHYAGRYDLGRLRAVRTAREFDERFIAHCFGFHGAEDYYARASAAAHLPAIGVPTLVVHAEDDPFVPLPEAARAALRSNPAVRLCLTPAGGHVGFISAGPGTDRLWAERRVLDFLCAVEGAGTWAPGAASPRGSSSGGRDRSLHR